MIDRIVNNPIVQVFAVLIFVMFVGVGLGAAFHGRGWQALMLALALIAAMVLGACLAGHRTVCHPKYVRKHKPHRLDVLG